MTEIVGLRFHDVTVDGSSLSLTFEGKSGEQITVSMLTEYLDTLMMSLARVKQEVSAKQRPKKLALSFRGLQSWSVTAIPGQEYVLVVLDGSTALEAPYALFPEMAEEFASALSRTSKIVRMQRKDN
jgi:hypothetical protein